MGSIYSFFFSGPDFVLDCLFSLSCSQCVFAPAVSALYGPRSDVVILTDDSFDKTVLKSDKPWIVEFYAPWVRGRE